MEHKKNIKKIIYIDMDGVIVNLDSEIKNWFKQHPHLVTKFEKCPDHIPGIFRDPEPVDGAIEAITKLYNSGKYELFIATSAPCGNPYSNAEKRLWVERYFGDMFHKKIIITHRKDLLKGDYLIDDRIKNGAYEFSGELLRFGYDYENNYNPNQYPDWDSILKYLL